MKQLILPSAASQIKFQQLAPNTFKKQILRFGRWINPKDSNKYFKVDKDFGDKLVANFKAGHFGHVSIPRGHNEDDPKLNTGEVIDLAVGDDGVYATCSIKDEEIATMLRNGLISDCSVAVSDEYQNHETGKDVGPVLRHLALTNQPYIKNLRKWEPAPPVQISQQLAAADQLAEVLYFSEDKPTMNREQLLAEAKKLGIDIVELEKLVAANQKLTADFQASETAKKAAETERDALKVKVDVKPGDKTPTEFKLEDQPAFKTLQTSVATLSEQNKAKDAEITTLKTENAKAKAVAEVQPLVDKGFILAKDKDTFVNLAMKDADTWQQIKPTLNVAKVELGERGAHTTPNGDFAHLSDGDAQKHINYYTENFITPRKKTKELKA